MNLTDNARVTQGVIQDIGEVERNGDTGVMVSTSQGIVSARLAFSCLVQPVCGDIVLLSFRDGMPFVLSILERGVAAPIEMRFAGSLSMMVAGDASLQASGSTAIGGGESASLKAREVRLSGESVEIAGDRVSMVGRAFSWLADTFESTARVMRQVSDVLSVRARSHQRQIEDLELVRVGHLDLRAEHILNIHAEHAIVKSRELVKLDGKQIQVG